MFLDVEEKYGPHGMRASQGARPIRGTFGPDPRNSKRFGRKRAPVPRRSVLRGIGGRLVPGAALAVGGLDLLDNAIEAYSRPHPNPVQPDPAFWELRHHCGRTPWGNPYLPVHPSYPYGVFSGHNSLSPLCAQLQAPSGTQGGDTAAVFLGETFVELILRARRRTVHTDGVIVRDRLDIHWRRIRNGVSTSRFAPYGFTPFASNPNPLRRAPGTRPAPWDAVPGRSATPRTDVPPFYFAAVPPGAPLPPAHVRQPPRKGEKEKKVISRAAKVGIFLWKMFDDVSELSEIVGGFYNALPKQYRTCKQGPSFGQYGLAVGECHSAAIYRHFDKIDPAEAFKNIAKNIAEDMTIGAFHKWLSKLYPPGISIERTVQTHALSKTEFEAYVVKRLNELWEFLGI